MLDEFLEAEEDVKNKGFFRRNFGRFGGGEKDGIDGGIRHTSVGGSWELKTLNGHPFGSIDL